jgi:archaellum component FlaG (FlaF/FlaG flagellin family)
MNKNNNKKEMSIKLDNNGSGNENTVNSKIDKSTKYSRKDFLKLLGTGAAFLTIGGLLNSKSRLETMVPRASAQTTIMVDNIELITEPNITVRAFASANSASSNYYSVISKPSNGQLNWAGRGMTYTPNIGFTGTDSFTYRAENDGVFSNVGTVNIDVKNSNPVPPYKYNILSRVNQKTRYTAHDTRTYFSDDTGEKRFQAVVESYDTPFINQEVTAVLTMKGVSATDRIELITRTGYPSNQYRDQRSGYVFYITNSGNQNKRFMILNKNTYEDRSSLVTPNFPLGGSLANKTFGMKAVTYVIPGTNNVKLEFYLDLNNTGDFRLYYQLIDSGQIPNARFVNPPGSTAKIRCDKITNSPTLKYFEIAEIDPQSPTSTVRSLLS